MAVDWIKTDNLSRTYERGEQQIKALDSVSLSIDRGEFVALVGSSGSGKSTLLNLLAGLDTPSSGDITVDKRRLDKLSRRERAAYRAGHVGMIFQSFNLLPHMTALQNVEIALLLSGVDRSEREPKARAMLDQLGIGDRLDHRPADLSGGEQQRVAIARALVKQPHLLLADEPTGNLDQDNSNYIADLLRKLNSEGLTIIMVTHDTDLAGRIASRTLKLHYGQLVTDTGGRAS